MSRRNFASIFMACYIAIGVAVNANADIINNNGTNDGITFDGPGGVGNVVSIAGNEAVVTNDYSTPDYIDMIVELDGTIAGTYTFIETITNNSVYDWSDFNWDLSPGDVRTDGFVLMTDDDLKFLSATVSGTWDLPLVEPDHIFVNGGTLLPGQSFSITYTVRVPAVIDVFTVRQYDTYVIAEVPTPSSLVGLIGLAGMIVGGNFIRRKRGR